MENFTDSRMFFTDIVSGVVVFSIIWWIVLFIILPIGIKTDPHPEKGLASSAPLKAKIGKRLLVTTLITIPLWFLAHYLIAQNVLGI